MKGSFGGLKQITVLKGYIMELSHILNQTRRKEDHLVRKIRKLKEKISQLQAIEAHNSAAYKKRIEEYETVLNKICRNIEF